MMQIKNKYKMLLIIVLVLVFFGVSIYIIINTLPRVGGIANVPENQVIRENGGVCILFLEDGGNDESYMLATAYCNELDKGLGNYKSVYDIWGSEKDKIISWDVPVECPEITITQEKTIKITKDSVCDFFLNRNPLKRGNN